MAQSTQPMSAEQEHAIATDALDKELRSTVFYHTLSYAQHLQVEGYSDDYIVESAEHLVFTLPATVFTTERSTMGSVVASRVAQEYLSVFFLHIEMARRTGIPSGCRRCTTRRRLRTAC